MTDARFPAAWLYNSRWKDLLVHEKWSYAAAIMWCVGEGKDGLIKQKHIDLIPDFDKSAIEVYENIGFLRITRAGDLQLCPGGEPWRKTQSLKATLDKQAEGNRKRQQAWRDRQAEQQ